AHQTILLKSALVIIADRYAWIRLGLGLRPIQPFQGQLPIELIVKLRSVGKMSVGIAAVARCQSGAACPIIAFGAGLRGSCGFAIIVIVARRFGRAAKAFERQLASQ